MAEILSTYLGPFLSFVLLYKYGALFLITSVAAFAIPIPASTLLVASGAFASQGYLNVYLVVLVAFLGNVTGDALGFFIARKYGIHVLERFGLGRIIHSKNFNTMTDYLKQFPQSLIFMTRFMTEVGPTVNILSGLSRVPPRVFFLFESLGELCYVMLYVTSGYLLGAEWESNLAFVAKGAAVIVTLSIFFGTLQVILYKKRRAHIAQSHALAEGK